MGTDALHFPVEAARRSRLMNGHISSRPLGKTSLAVTELGLGGAPLGNLYQEISERDALDTGIAALECGIAYFDTAPYYGFGLSERRVGDFLRGRDSIVVSTKVGRLLRPESRVRDSRARHGFLSPMPFEPVFDYTFDGVMASWEASIQRLGLAKVDILYVHDIGSATHRHLEAEYFRQLTEGGGFRALNELRGGGVIGAFGLGVNETAICLQAMDHADLDVILLAGRYTLLEQDALDVLFPTCERSGTSIVIGGPYNSGILATGTRRQNQLHYNYAVAPPAIVDRVRRLEAHCDRFDIPLAAAALQFPLAHRLVASVIPGICNEDHIARTVALYQTKIPNEFWQDLKADGLLRADAPTAFPRPWGPDDPPTEGERHETE
jgi:D-threo-aldose 1-dehydrogenase